MGDYNADPVPNSGQANMLVSGYFFCLDRPLYFDQWTIDPTTRVDKFCDGRNIVNVKIKYDPTIVPT